MDLSPAGGCGCKMRQGLLNELLAGMERDLGIGGPDFAAEDAGLLTVGQQEVLLTIDIQTPISPTVERWGAVAAVNALSDIYAMGGRPLGAVAFLGWPAGRSITEGRSLLNAGAKALRADGVALLGGHTITSEVPTFGYCVLGSPGRGGLMTVASGRVGDQLVLTKPLGSGVASSAEKAGIGSSVMYAAAHDVMVTSNGRAAEVAASHAVRCATDVTGFGLVGHAHNIAKASGLRARLSAGALPVIPGVVDTLASGFVPDGLLRNRADAENYTSWSSVDEVRRNVVCDPQTSGGLLLAVSGDSVVDLCYDLSASGVPAAIVGEFVEGTPGVVEVLPQIAASSPRF